MNCESCPFNTKSSCYSKSLLKKVPDYLHNVFTCNGQTISQKKNVYNQICPAMLWVVVYIGSKEEYSLNHAEETLVALVERGQSELICTLFENSPYEIRRKMWQTMTTKYSNRMYVFNPLFEREELEPVTHNGLPQKAYPVYRQQLLYGKYSPKELYQWS